MQGDGHPLRLHSPIIPQHIPTPLFVLEIWKACFVGLIESPEGTEELKWTAFTFLKVPGTWEQQSTRSSSGSQEKQRHPGSLSRISPHRHCPQPARSPSASSHRVFSLKVPGLYLADLAGACHLLAHRCRLAQSSARLAQGSYGSRGSGPGPRIRVPLAYGDSLWSQQK